MDILQMIWAFIIYLWECLTLGKVLTALVLLTIGFIGGAISTLCYLTGEEGPRAAEDGLE